MFKRQINQRGGLVLMELGILAVLLVTIAAVLTQASHLKPRTKPAQTTQKQPTNSPATSVNPSPSTQTTITPENPSSNPPVASSGIKGQIYAGAGTGCYSTEPNSTCGKPHPQAGTVIIKGSNGIIISVKSNSSGYFMVKANPGTYRVDLQTGGAATTVEVKARTYTEITLYVN